MWNGLFTLLFKIFSERVAGSDRTSRIFYTIIYGLYHGINLDYGAILWAQLIQSTASATRNTEISYARFWPIIVKRALVHFEVPLTDDSIVVSIPILQTLTIMMSDPSKFTFVGSIPKVMFAKVLQDNVIVNEYQKLPPSGARPMTEEM